MAYMRGDPYIWSSEADIHIHGHPLPHATMEELVVMLHAEMTPEQIEAAEMRAAEKWAGNVGCEALLKKRGLPSPWDALGKRWKG